MDLRELRSFCAVAQYGSITKAADQLMLRQPAVTLHIQELERETGVTLLDRSKRPVQLTPAGAHLAELAKPLLRQIDSLPVETSSYARQGSLTVASTTEMARNMLVDSIVTYRETYPDTRLQLRSGRLPEVLRMVRDRDADLGLRAADRAFPGVQRRGALHQRAGAAGGEGPSRAGRADREPAPDRQLAAHRQRRDARQSDIHRGQAERGGAGLHRRHAAGTTSTR